jgi:hypothetical protein
MIREKERDWQKVSCSNVRLVVPRSARSDAAEIKCPYCGNLVIVPEGLRRVAPDSVTPQTFASVSEGSSSSGILGVIVGFVVLLIIVGVVGAVLLGALSNSKSSPLAGAQASPTPAGLTHVVLSFGGEGTAPRLFQDARHIAVDQDGNRYVDDYRTLCV